MTIEAGSKRATMDPRGQKALARDGVELAAPRTRAQFTCFVAAQHAFWAREMNVESD